MKKLFTLFTLIFTIITCNAQTDSLTNKKHHIRWMSIDLVVDSEALNHMDKFSWAVASPGEKIEVGRIERTVRLKPVFKKIVEIKRKSIIYNKETSNIYYTAERDIKERSSYVILLSIMSVLLTIVSNILYEKKGYRRMSVVAIFLASVLTSIFFFVAFISLFVPTFTALIVIFLSAIVACYAGIAADCKLVTLYRVMSIMFYITMLASLILVFL